MLLREAPQTGERLTYEALGAVRSFLFRNRNAFSDERDVGALARIKRLAHIGGSQLARPGVVLEIGRKQIGMARTHLPHQRKNALMGKTSFPRRPNRARRRPPQFRAERIAKHPFPRVELEGECKVPSLKVDEAAFVAPADVLDVDQRSRESRLDRSVLEIGEG